MSKDKTKKRKTIFRYFTIVDFEEEEVFLREQHRQGYRLAKFILPGFYCFEECEPEDMVYQLDFSDISLSEKPDYLQMFRDYGWEYLFDAMGWSYFRKPAGAAREEDVIFSDMESKLSLLEKVYRRRMLPVIILIFCAIIYQICYVGYLWARWADAGMRFSWWTLTAAPTETTAGLVFFALFMVFIFLAVLWELWVLVHCQRGFSRLKNKYLKK